MMARLTSVATYGSAVTRSCEDLDCPWTTICARVQAANAVQARTARPGRHPDTITAASAMNPRPPLIPDWNWCWSNASADPSEAGDAPARRHGTDPQRARTSRPEARRGRRVLAGTPAPGSRAASARAPTP